MKKGNPRVPRAIAARTESGVEFAMLPPQRGGPAATLLLLAMAGADTLRTDPYRRVGQILHRRGWNIASLDLPCHGADRRAGEPEELAGWAERIRRGEDIAAAFQRRANAVLEHLIAAGIADPRRLAAAGTSRGGFMAFHAALGNPRVRAVAAFSPVTDLGALREFAGQEQNSLMAQLALVDSAEQLTDRAIWITIGNADERVDTDRVIGFARAVAAACRKLQRDCATTLHVLPIPGHRSDVEWHRAAATWLKDVMSAAGC